MVNLLAGIVYAVEFDNGMIKVGMSSNPGKERIYAATAKARKIGAAYKREWTSEYVFNRYESEKLLLEHCIDSGGKLEIGKEWVSGVDFDELIRYSEKIFNFIPKEHEIFCCRRDISLNKEHWDFFRKQMGNQWLREEIQKKIDAK